MAVRDMTRGNIVRQLVGYTIPLVLGNIFQLAYNAVDSMIAGRFIGAEALAATGMAGPVMNILILGISGICIGAGVLMSSFFGSGSIEKLKRELGTLLVSGTVFSVALTALGVIFIEPLLTVLNVPESIHDFSSVHHKSHAATMKDKILGGRQKTSQTPGARREIAVHKWGEHENNLFWS